MPQGNDEELERFYQVGELYNMRKKPKEVEDDQFVRWINLEGSGLKNQGGIRWLRSLRGDQKKYDGIFLFTDEKKSGTNPWNDEIDFDRGVINYWGDAKKSMHYRDAVGNKALLQCFEEEEASKKPFILHFTKKETGVYQFNGLCVLEELQLKWHQHESTPVLNYKVRLGILSCDRVYVHWLRNWRTMEKLPDRLKGAPDQWKTYIKRSRVDRLTSWTGQIHKKKEQMPPTKDEMNAISELRKIHPIAFENLVVDLVRDIGGQYIAGIEVTKPIKDNGFDFEGQFVMSEPFRYRLTFKGEVKRYGTDNSVGPKDLSRLVASLERGQFGVFITTSYFTAQAQEEAIERKYPIHLINAKELIGMIKRSDHWKDNSLDQTWLDGYERDNNNDNNS